VLAQLRMTEQAAEQHVAEVECIGVGYRVTVPESVKKRGHRDPRKGVRAPVQVNGGTLGPSVGSTRKETTLSAKPLPTESSTAPGSTVNSTENGSSIDSIDRTPFRSPRPR